MTKAKRRKPRLSDVAEMAGVGIATVDRVLNERGHVSEDVTRRVIEAARTLGLPRILPSPYRSGLRIGVVVARRDSDFIERLKREFRRIASTLDRSIIVEIAHLDESKPRDIARHIETAPYDALVLYAQEQPEIIEAVNERTTAGVPVVTVVSDLPSTPRLSYVGIDHYGAGATAAFFMGSMVRIPGDLLVVCHSFEYRAHAQRVSGFREKIGEYNPELAISAVLETKDQPLQTERDILKKIMESERGIVGIYNASGANLGVSRAFQSDRVESSTVPRPFLVEHGLTKHLSALLEKGIVKLVIDQNPVLQAAKSFDVLLAHFGYLEAEPVRGELPFSIITPENNKL